MSFQIPEVTRQRQDLASRPRASAWVSANAGSGKTFVLSRRVVRLLLDGTDPSRILALTFTKAAAAEMATRVFKIPANGSPGMMPHSRPNCRTLKAANQMPRAWRWHAACLPGHWKHRAG